MAEGRRAALLGTLVVALSAVALVAKFPSHPVILVELNNAAHAPVFGALAIVWLHLLRGFSALSRWQRYLAAFALSVAIGGLVELIQPIFDRGSESLDLMADALGAIAGLAAMAAFELRRRWLLLPALIALVPVLWPVGEVAMAYRLRAREFPTLLGYDVQAERHFIHSFGIEFEAVRLPQRWRRKDDPRSLRIRIRGGKFPRIALMEPQPDWRGYSRLMLDVTNPEDRPLMLTLRVYDRDHDNLRAADRFNRKITLAASERRVLSFPLAEIAASPAGRGMDMSRIARVILFGKNGSDLAGREYYLTRLWLE
jgi:VanZ family protein